ncbi:hypothetical protein [Vibrio parahaemolyticus]|uniref:hypothetical protein n=1 Tax=Vibrio parahaemolyticus TaxID=670 RepID=UPI002B1F82AA|nr:hypothetical protein [Vibrio parahaemolyticus]MEA5377339.1 hypothetical protein [Vibrio parahaemolyticus]
MSEFQALIESNRRLAEVVEGKVAEIDQSVEEQIEEMNKVLSSMFLDSRFGIQPSHEQFNPQNITGAEAGSTVVVPILTVDVVNASSFNQASFVLDIVASGAVSSSNNWYRQLHVAFKQQHQTFTYNVKCTVQNGGGTGVVAVTYDPNGGQFGAGQLKIWVNSYAGYNTMAFVARGTLRRYDANAGRQVNDLGALHFRKEEGFLANSSQHLAVKALPNYTDLDL